MLEMEDSETDRVRREAEEKGLQAQGVQPEELQRVVQHIRILSMQLQRHKPAEWNEFLDVAL